MLRCYQAEIIVQLLDRQSYLLISDIFESQGDYFQAKSTLQSIIDNYKGADEIVSLAKEKLTTVTAKESSQSKLKQESETDTETEKKHKITIDRIKN
jgi:hypothetical protein